MKKKLLFFLLSFYCFCVFSEKNKFDFEKYGVTVIKEFDGSAYSESEDEEFEENLSDNFESPEKDLPCLENPPVFIDEFNPGLVKGSVKSGKTLFVPEIKALCDGKFVVHSGRNFILFNQSGDVVCNLNSQIPDLENYTDYDWHINTYDRKSLFLVHKNSSRVFYLDKNLEYDGGKTFVNPQNAIMVGGTELLFPDGTPILISYGENTVYLFDRTDHKVLLKNQSSVKYCLTSRSNCLEVFTDESNVDFYSEKIEYLKTVKLNLPENCYFEPSFIDENDNIYGVINQWAPERNFSAVKFNSAGKLCWKIKQSVNSQYTVTDFYDGIYYFSARETSISETVYRYAENLENLPEDLKKIALENQKIQNNPDEAENYLALADIYENFGGNYGAYQACQNYLKLNPGDSKVQDRLLNLEAKILKFAADLHAEKALELFEQYGEETAAEEYSAAMKIYEKIIKQNPWNQDTVNDAEQLKQIMGKSDSAGGKTISSTLDINQVDLSFLFPVLTSYYAEHSCGTISVKNKSAVPVKNLRIEAFIKKYMDFPAEGETVPELQPGEEGLVKITVFLNQNSMEISEDIKSQINYVLKWEENGVQKSMKFSRPVTIYSKSAIIWADTGMLACFTTPNDKIVTDFAFKVAGAQTESPYFSRNFNKALALADAIGTLPVHYVSDPVSPASRNAGNIYSIDTVKFPAETLNLSGGDCDDLTALYCSLLESVGIKTAFITTPGHIFAAFDSGLKMSLFWKDTFEEFPSIEINGNVWIPVEVTVLNQGFLYSWKTAGKEISQKKYEVTVVEDQRENFPAVSFNDAHCNTVLPSQENEKTVSQENSKLKKNFSGIFNQLQLADYSDSDLNSLAKICYSFGDLHLALQYLNDAVLKNDKNLAAHKNLRKIYQQLGDINRMKNCEAKIGLLEKNLQEHGQNLNRAEDFSAVESELEE